MNDDIIAKRVANALVEDAELDVPAAATAVPSVFVVKKMLPLFRKQFGGLWVGGTVVLTARRITFAANGMNRALQSGTLSWEIPLDAIRDVEVRPGAFTRILAIATPEATTKIRCYRADALAEQIREAAGHTRP